MEGMKHFGWGVVDSNGCARRSFYDSQIETAHKFAQFFNEEKIEGAPYRVVELFYKDEQP